MSLMQAEGKITICKRSSRDGECIVVYLTEKDSGVKFAEAEVSFESFSQAVTGGIADCTLRIADLENIGTDSKIIRVFVPEVEAGKDPFRRLHTAGWTPLTNDYGNHHKRGCVKGQNGYWVHAIKREVRHEDGKIVAPIQQFIYDESSRSFHHGYALAMAFMGDMREGSQIEDNMNSNGISWGVLVDAKCETYDLLRIARALKPHGLRNVGFYDVPARDRWCKVLEIMP